MSDSLNSFSAGMFDIYEMMLEKFDASETHAEYQKVEIIKNMQSKIGEFNYPNEDKGELNIIQYMRGQITALSMLVGRI